MGKPSLTREEKHAKINASLVKFCPELASSTPSEVISPYAAFPMTRENWMDPSEKNPATGESLFQASPENVGPKPDHVHGRGPLGVGYYHLLTKQPYFILYAKHNSTAPSSCCCANQEVRDNYDEWDDVRLLLYKRTKATIANDAAAEGEVISQAQATAKTHYNRNQNFQLAVGTAMTVANAT